MYIQGLGQLTATVLKPVHESKNGDGTKKSLFKIVDAYEPSGTQDRTELIREIKKKISAGFYNSDKVADDLSYGFASILNQ
jgi:anti-sigma28 factor (negative regulator of flagellin synthesis)